jgi:protein ImuB
MRRRIVSIWLPRLATDVIARRQSQWRDNPLALYLETGQKLIVMAVNAPADAEGVVPGMTLANARAVLSDLATLPFRPARQFKAQKALLRWLDRFSPLVGLDGADGLFVDVTGVTHLFGGEGAFLAQLTENIEALGFSVRIGLANTPGAAWALARYGRPGTIAGPGETREALARLPVAALRFETETMHRLMRLGLTHVDNLYALPRQALVRRFGVKTATRLDQALGASPEPISPIRTPAPYIVHMRFEEPIGERSSVEIALARLITQLSEKLKRHNKGVTALDLIISRLDGGQQNISIGVAEPTRDEKRLARLFNEKLDDIDPGFGIESAKLIATGIGVSANRQSDALGPKAPPEAMAKLIDTLGNRLGFNVITRFEPMDRWQPDRGFCLSPATASVPETSWPEPPGPRPLMLLKRPEPVQVEADVSNALAPPQALRRHGAWRKLDHAEGPERITPEWRHEDRDWPTPRDYWRAQDETGARLWLFRAGKAWFLHGFFA